MGGTDIVSLTIRKKQAVMLVISLLIVNGIIMVLRAFFWLGYALYSMVTIFVSSPSYRCDFHKTKENAGYGVASNPDPVVRMIQKKLHRGVTLINDAEGTYNHERAVLLAIITREEYTDFKHYMSRSQKPLSPSQKNVHILGRFVDLDNQKRKLTNVSSLCWRRILDEMPA